MDGDSFLIQVLQKGLVSFCRLPVAHHLLTVGIRTGLVFLNVPRDLWQPTKKDNTASVSLV